jgi:hypothetical protein
MRGGNGANKTLIALSLSLGTTEQTSAYTKGQGGWAVADVGKSIRRGSAVLTSRYHAAEL